MQPLQAFDARKALKLLNWEQYEARSMADEH
jgi:hypothetical protein